MNYDTFGVKSCELIIAVVCLYLHSFDTNYLVTAFDYELACFLFVFELDLFVMVIVNIAFSILVNLRG